MSSDFRSAVAAGISSCRAIAVSATVSELLERREFQGGRRRLGAGYVRLIHVSRILHS